MAIASYAEVASSRDFQARWDVHHHSASNSLNRTALNPRVSNLSVHYEVKDQVRLLSIRLHSQINGTEIERLRCDLFTLLFRSSTAELIAAQNELRHADIFTTEYLDLRKAVRSCLLNHKSFRLPPLVLDLVARLRFAESMAIAKLMHVGSDRDLVLRHISIGFVTHGRLLESTWQIRQITDRAFGCSTVGIVAEVLVDQHHFADALKLLDTLPNAEKFLAKRRLALKLAQQGRSVESEAMANTIAESKVREEVLLDVFETNHVGMDCLKLCVSGFSQCCQAIQLLFRRCCSR